MKIAVTGVGGGVGQSILKAIASSDYDIIAMDSEILGTGLYASSKSYLIPYAKDENYIPKLLEICKKEEISLLFPGLDAELLILSTNANLFKKIGTTIVVSRPEVISIADNKQFTFDVLSKAGINVPFTASAENYEPNENSFPLIIKPREGGARSKNVFVAKNLIDYNLVLEKIGIYLSDYIIMDYIEGDEYTCGTINLDNNCKGIIVMRRFLRDGDTNKCFVENNKIIEAVVKKVVDTIKPFGACNIQLRIKNNIPYIFEINARCSGTTAARALSGFNEPLMIADYLLKYKKPSFTIKEQTILRYWKELVVENTEIELLMKNGMLDKKNHFPNL